MLFRSKTAAKTWDAWVYRHRGVYYLYYLISEKFVCDGFGLATSADGVHWQDHGWVVRPSEEMVRYLGSGSVWESLSPAQTGRFLCNYSEWHMEDGKNVQRIFFAGTDDLLHWKKIDGSFRIDERFYQRIKPDARGPWEDPRWDGMCVVPRPEGGYFGYWTATPKDGPGFGFGVSGDGLHWQALQPPCIEWNGEPSMVFIEVGGVHEIDGKYYAMLADYAGPHCGMFSFVADAPAGPFRPATRNFDLLRNRSRMHAYFTRFVDSPDGVLVIHHSLAEGQFSDEHCIVYYAPLKRAIRVDDALYLAWWEGNERLKEQETVLDPATAQVHCQAGKGTLLEGRLLPPGRLIVQGGEKATVIQVDEQGRTEIGPIEIDGSGFRSEENVDRELDFGPAPRFRLLIHHTMLELYLNDIFIQCYSMPGPFQGVLTCQNGADLRLWQWN